MGLALTIGLMVLDVYYTYLVGVWGRTRPLDGHGISQTLYGGYIARWNLNLGRFIVVSSKWRMAPTAQAEAMTIFAVFMAGLFL